MLLVSNYPVLMWRTHGKICNCRLQIFHMDWANTDKSNITLRNTSAFWRIRWGKENLGLNGLCPLRGLCSGLKMNLERSTTKRNKTQLHKPIKRGAQTQMMGRGARKTDLAEAISSEMRYLHRVWSWAEVSRPFHSREVKGSYSM